jgi:hypothetical protein
MHIKYYIYFIFVVTNLVHVYIKSTTANMNGVSEKIAFLVLQYNIRLVNKIVLSH